MTHRGGGAHRFIDHVQRRRVGDGGQKHRGQEQNGKGHTGDAHCLADGVPGDRPAKHGNIIFPLDRREGRREQHRGGHCLDAPRGAHRRAADKHQQQGDDGGGIGQVFLGEGGEARRSGGHRLEKGRLQLLGKGQARHGQGIAVFKGKKQRRAGQNQHRRGGQRDLAVEGQPAERVSLFYPGLPQHPQYIPPDDVADAAQYHQPAGDGVDRGIGGIAAQAVFGDDINARVAEGGHRGEHRHPNAPWAQLRHEHGHIQKGARALYNKRPGKDLFHKGAQTGQGVEVKGVL